MRSHNIAHLWEDPKGMLHKNQYLMLNQAKSDESSRSVEFWGQTGQDSGWPWAERFGLFLDRWRFALLLASRSATCTANVI